MKAIYFVTAFLLFSSNLLLAQHPLVGTWEMVSGKGINAEGERFSIDTTTVREIKIITPTHYMLIACDVSGDSLLFNRTMAGTVGLDGDKYIEIPTHASVQIFPNLQVDFRWKLVNGQFIQSGTIVRPDGKTIVLEELIFRKVRSGEAQTENPAIGTWHQVSGSYTTSDGQKVTDFKPGDRRLLLITPTHWMRMDLKKDDFERAIYGTYAYEGDEVQVTLNYSSSPFTEGEKTTLTQSLKGDTLHTKTTGVTPDGKKVIFEASLKRAE